MIHFGGSWRNEIPWNEVYFHVSKFASTKTSMEVCLLPRTLVEASTEVDLLPWKQVDFSMEGNGDIHSKAKQRGRPSAPEETSEVVEVVDDEKSVPAIKPAIAYDSKGNVVDLPEDIIKAIDGCCRTAIGEKAPCLLYTSDAADE